MPSPLRSNSDLTIGGTSSEYIRGEDGRGRRLLGDC